MSAMMTNQKEDRAFATRVRNTGRRLLEYCESRDFAGYDPYDALNSRLLKLLPVLESRIPRLILTQLLKRSPVDLRRLLQIPPTQNPKGIAIFLAALLKSPDLRDAGAEGLIRELAEKLVTLRSDNGSYSS